MSIQARRLTRTRLTPVPSGPTPPAALGYSRSITEFGAVADGTTNDYVALLDTINDVAGNGGGVVRIPDQPVALTLAPGSGGFWLPANVVVKGDGASSELLFTAADAGWYAMFHFYQNGAHLENLKITRANDVYGVAFVLDPSQDTWLYNVTLDGHKDTATSEFHGILINGDSPGVINNFYIVNSTIRRCEYGLLQPSARTVTVTNVTVYGSLFELNTATDLEFNAPSSLMQNVSVTYSTFRNNLSASAAAGFGVGLANVQTAQIDHCTFYDYPINHIHIEDRSSYVSVTNCTFAKGSTAAAVAGFRSFIIILGSPVTDGGSNNIAITDNLFDTTQQTEVVDCVFVGDGGAPAGPPHDVTVINNHAIIANASQVVGIYNATNVTTTPNTVTTS